MAYKLLNKRATNIKLTELEDKTRADVEALQQGEYTICVDWEDVEKVLMCFEDTEEWQIEQLSNKMFALLPEHTTAQQKNKFKMLMQE